VALLVCRNHTNIPSVCECACERVSACVCVVLRMCCEHPAVPGVCVCVSECVCVCVLSFACVVYTPLYLVCVCV